MNRVVITVALAILSTSVLAQPGGMSGIGLEGETKGVDKRTTQADKGRKTHKTVGVVKKVDPKAGSVTLAHEPVKSMNWPAMTMAFKVKDKAMLDKFVTNKKVEVEFEEQGKEHVITGVR